MGERLFEEQLRANIQEIPDNAINRLFVLLLGPVTFDSRLRIRRNSRLLNRCQNARQVRRMWPISSFTDKRACQ